MSDITAKENASTTNTDKPPAIAIHNDPVIHIIHKASCNKLSHRARGYLLYQTGYSKSSGQLYLRIADNVTGGCFSGEWVSLDSIEHSLEGFIDTNKPFSAPTLRPAFISKSQNNAGFMAAILLAEGIIEKMAEKQHLLQMTKAGFAPWIEKWSAKAIELTENPDLQAALNKGEVATPEPRAKPEPKQKAKPKAKPTPKAAKPSAQPKATEE